MLSAFLPSTTSSCPRHWAGVIRGEIPNSQLRCHLDLDVYYLPVKSLRITKAVLSSNPKLHTHRSCGYLLFFLYLERLNFFSPRNKVTFLSVFVRESYEYSRSCCVSVICGTQSWYDAWPHCPNDPPLLPELEKGGYQGIPSLRYSRSARSEAIIFLALLVLGNSVVCGSTSLIFVS